MACLMFPRGMRTVCMISRVHPGLDLYYAYPARPLRTAGEELHDLDHDLICLSEVCKVLVAIRKA